MSHKTGLTASRIHQLQSTPRPHNTMTYGASIIVLSDSVEMKMPTPSDDSVAGAPASVDVSEDASGTEEHEGGRGSMTDAPPTAASLDGSNADRSKDLKEPLVPSSKAGYGAVHTSVPRLYDTDSTLHISKDVASGYLVLLTGGTVSSSGVGKGGRLKEIKRTKTKKCCSRLRSSSQHSSGGDTSSTINTRIPDDAIALAFMSLTDGNVVDSLFGVQGRGGIKRAKETSKFAYEAAREAKEALREASYSSEAIPRIAVEAYELCFEVVIDYHKRLDKLGFFSQCYQREVIRGEAEESLEEAFAILREAVEAAT